MTDAHTGTDITVDSAGDMALQPSRSPEPSRPPAPLKQQVREALAASPIQSHRKIRVDQTGDTLTLHGCVESFYYKQLAQEVVRNICRGVNLSNDLAVADPPAVTHAADY